MHGQCGGTEEGIALDCQCLRHLEGWALSWPALARAAQQAARRPAPMNAQRGRQRPEGAARPGHGGAPASPARGRGCMQSGGGWGECGKSSARTVGRGQQAVRPWVDRPAAVEYLVCYPMRLLAQGMDGAHSAWFVLHRSATHTQWPPCHLGTGPAAGRLCCITGCLMGFKASRLTGIKPHRHLAAAGMTFVWP